ncbi:MAG: hypothetical protein LUE98_13360 [Tannerellaceae bacterium]|nr:hypothetical protein [Tannerellaceae bacterium]
MCVLLIFFAACSDDDGDDNNNGPDPEWSDYVATFSTDNVLTLNGTLNKDKDVQVVLAKGTDDKAKLTLKNIVIESATVEINNVEMKEETNGTYTFTANQPIAESVITVSGILTPGEVTKATGPTPVALELTVTRKITSDLVGEWKLDMNGPFTLTPNLKEDAGQQSAGMWTIMQGMINDLVNEALKAKVKDVKINFQTNGTFNFSWLPVGENDYKTIADIDNPMIGAALSATNFEYYTNDKDGVVYIGDQSLRGLIELSNDMDGLLEMYPEIANYGSIIKLAANFFEVQGKYGIIPLDVANSENGGKAFSLTLPAAALDDDLLGMLFPLLSQFPQFSLEQLEDLIKALDSLTVQLNFK